MRQFPHSVSYAAWAQRMRGAARERRIGEASKRASRKVPLTTGENDMVAMPETVKVGYRDYAVELTDTPAEDDAMRIGACMHGRARITIQAGMDRHRTAMVMVHEILHAVWYVWNLPDEEAAEEETAIAALSNGLATVLRDNPQLRDWLMESFE